MKQNMLRTLSRALALMMVCMGVTLAMAAQAMAADEDLLGNAVDSLFDKLDVAGMAVAIVDEDGLLYFKGCGYRNVQEKLPVTEDTVFLMASVTKTVTGTAVMQLAEDGRIDLDADISRYLPYAVRNPNNPDVPITARMLLCHTASVADNWEVLDQTYTYGGDPQISLQTFCKEYFTENGRWYDDWENFLEEKPGTVYEYANCGYALLGYLVEQITGQPFYAYCRERIFEPLGMAQTSLMLEALDAEPLAVPYSGGRALEHYTFATYPDGGLRTSCGDFAKFIAMMINEGAYQGAAILRADTVRAMLTQQYAGIAENQGLTWDLAVNELYGLRSDGTLVGHNGGENGADTLVFFNPDTCRGAMILINDEVSDRRASVYDDLLEMLIQVVND